MKCSLCHTEGHTKRSCKTLMESKESVESKEEKDDHKEEKFDMDANSIEVTSMISKVIQTITSIPHKDIILLRQPQVIQWLFGDTSFLPPIERVNKTKDEEKYKVLEDAWGQAMLRIRRPDLKLDKQWTNKFGEHLCEELFTVLGKTVTKPVKQNHYQPDSETDEFILEAKAQTYFTSGTAGEKILGTPFKYAEIPELYGKPLKIICMGGAEKVCRENYGNLPGPKQTVQKQEFIAFYKKMGIEYVGATDILRGICY